MTVGVRGASYYRWEDNGEEGGGGLLDGLYVIIVSKASG